jgi:hypothetical protein
LNGKRRDDRYELFLSSSCGSRESFDDDARRFGCGRRGVFFFFFFFGRVVVQSALREREQNSSDGE